MLHNMSKGNIQLIVMNQSTHKEFSGMAIKETVKQLKDLLSHLQADIDKADGGNKAASQRVRTGTVKLEKVAKRYRKESIISEKSSKGKKPAKKSAKAKPAAKAAGKAKAKPKAAKAKGRSSHASVSGRALSVRRPTAKLPTAKRIRWS